MEILILVWNKFFYIPLFNALIWLYNNWANENLGYAVIILTVALRTALLPLSIVSERNKLKHGELDENIAAARKSYKKDPVLLKSEVRKLLRKYKVNPWAKTVILGIQVLVLVLLYQVFIHGITRSKLNVLYSFVDRPEVINTKFYGFELGIRDVYWAAAVGLVVFIEIYLNHRRRKSSVTRNEQIYAVLFPLASFLALYALPMVKSVFILTTLAFSYILSMLRRAFFSPSSE